MNEHDKRRGLLERVREHARQANPANFPTILARIVDELELEEQSAAQVGATGGDASQNAPDPLG